MLHEVASGLAFALLVPVLFKILDFFISFRLVTVSIFFVIWGAITVLWLVWRTRGLGAPLQQIAASVDDRSRGNDQLKTAYWFIRNPKESEWVELQIRRAAASARSIAVNQSLSQEHAESLVPCDRAGSLARPSQFHAAALEQ